jgi:protein SCO1
MKRRTYLGAVLAMAVGACLSLSACKPGDVSFKHTDLTGLSYAQSFSLHDTQGKLRTLIDFKGQLVVVFFGYTQCPDVCPTTLQEMAQVMKKLGDKAKKVQVIFVSLDPERDTPEILSQYVPAFDARFLALTGDVAAIKKTAAEFKVVYQKVPGKQEGSYSIDHTAASFVFDTEGRIRLFVRPGQGPDLLAHDLELLLSQAK